MPRLLVLELMLSVFVVGLNSRVSSQLDSVTQFLKFITDFKKPYKNGTFEFRHRLEIFKNNLRWIEAMNKPYKDGSVVYGITKFSDLSQEEFKELYLKDLQPELHKTSLIFSSEKLTNLALKNGISPAKIDWRESRVISSVKNQGHCGACWAFSAAESVESAFAIYHNTTVPILSVQQLIDCSKNNSGCEGGTICNALEYIQMKGITYENVYPLTDKDGLCQLLPYEKLIQITGYTCSNLVEEEDQIIRILATVGPVAAAVDATTWNNYVGGIIKFHCGTNINHAVQIVGYDLTGSVPYYIVRNSWGTDFGMKGYLFIKKGSNLCGIAEEVSSVNVA